ncbi:MAG: hypothetical protein M1827_005197 [Pycnora praestabilis]|nr:MAG: hypothetical protein M1827_005197 [Pycnora praestabilis]
MSATTSGSDDDLRSKGQQPILASQRAKQQANAPSEANRTGKVGGYFTLGYKEGFSQWWANMSPAVAEHTVLSYVPYLQRPPTHTQTGSAPPSTTTSTISINDQHSHKATPVTTNSVTDPYGPRTWHSNLVKLSGKDRALNEFSVERVGEEVEQNLIILHGYGAGLGFFYKNFECLSRAKGWKLYALDMLGMGRSSRPPFRIHAKDQQGKIMEAESWFVDALEEWRVKKKMDRFTLLAHSLGGYMAVAYALKYPGHLNKLILASPVGIPEDPYAVNAAMPEPGDSTLGNEFTQDEADVVNASNPNIPDPAKVGDNNRFLNARSSAEKDKANGTSGNTTTPSAPRKPLPKWLTYLWDANISPFSIVRMTGPLGPRFVSGWTSRRFAHLPPEEAQALHNYAYTLFKQRGSGEYALAYVLAPGAFARSPLIRRIQGVGRQMIIPSTSLENALSTAPSTNSTEKRRENGIPVVIMYGENDWMDIKGGYAAVQKMKEEKERILRDATSEERKNDNGSAKVTVIRKAGHHVYLDGHEEFNKVMLEEMEDVSRKDKRRSV